MSIKVGDVFFWSYKDSVEFSPYTDRYWCKDRIAVAVDDGSELPDLVDIYWGGVFKTYVGSNDFLLDLEKVDIKFICNIKDIRVIQEYEVRDYDNVYNLSNQKGCCRMFAVDKHAKVSNSAILKKYKEDLAEFEYKKSYAESQIQQLTSKIKEIE